MTVAAMPIVPMHGEAQVAAAEADGAPRLPSLDVMRGIAILGILFMNINAMGGPMWAMLRFDIRHVGWSTTDAAVWTFREVLATGTARCLLEMLFGAGIALMAARGVSVLRYYWRNAVLFLFGVAHVYLLLWSGDILHTYAIAAMVVFLCRHLPAGALLTAGLAMVALPLAGDALAYRHVAGQREAATEIRARAAAAGRAPGGGDAAILASVAEHDARVAAWRRESAAAIAAEDVARRAGFREWAGATWAFAQTLRVAGMETASIWEAVSTMLIGAALFGWGILQGRRSWRCYAALSLLGYGVGIGLRIVGVRHVLRFDDAPSPIGPFYEVARIATTLGHVGAIHLLLGTALGAAALRPFGAAGRTALSIYVLQTLVCVWVLYPPWGLALYGRQGWAALMATAAGVNLGLLLLANWWVRHYRIAPVEWAWRSIVEGRPLPFRRGDAAFA